MPGGFQLFQISARKDCPALPWSFTPNMPGKDFHLPVLRGKRPVKNYVHAR